MTPVHRHFDDLSTVVDDVHGLFVRLENGDGKVLPLESFSLQVMKLAVHEWIANLVQHADFGRQRPGIHLSLLPEGQRVRCVIEDNSDGFDFARQIVHQQHHLDLASEPPDRGRGLLMLIACTENLSYQPLGAASPHRDGLPAAPRHRLEFWISPHTASEPITLDPSFDAAFGGSRRNALTPPIDLDSEDG